MIEKEKTPFSGQGEAGHSDANLNNKVNEKKEVSQAFSFPLVVFPEEIQSIINTWQESMGLPVDYLASGVLSATSVAIGNSVSFVFKNSWHIKANLFMAIIGLPGDGKSPALKVTFDPIIQRDKQKFKAYKQKINEDELSEKQTFSKQIVSKTLISDFTPEALIKIHEKNPNGVCVYADELIGWIGNFSRYNKSSETEFYLSAWSAQPISIDRASGESVRIDSPFISVIGGIQGKMLASLFNGGRAVNGFVERMLYVYPCDNKIVKWSHIECPEDTIQNYSNIINRLMLLGGEDQNAPSLVRISETLKVKITDWQRERVDVGNYKLERGFEVKITQYFLKFILILASIDAACKNKSEITVNENHVKSAELLVDYFENCAIKAYSELSEDDSANDLKSKFVKSLPSNFSTAEAIELGKQMSISNRTINEWLKMNPTIEKVAHGKYKKVS